MKHQNNHPVRVLIADDHQTTRYALKQLLNFDPNIEVIGEAANGQEAVQLIAQTQPDLVVLDGLMPVLDGPGATRQIKRQWPEVKVIVLTSSSAYLDKTRAAGADACLLKGPGDYKELRDTILSLSQ